MLRPLHTYLTSQNHGTRFVAEEFDDTLGDLDCFTPFPSMEEITRVNDIELPLELSDERRLAVQDVTLDEPYTKLVLVKEEIVSQIHQVAR